MVSLRVSHNMFELEIHVGVGNTKLSKLNPSFLMCICHTLLWMRWLVNGSICICWLVVSAYDSVYTRMYVNALCNIDEMMRVGYKLLQWKRNWNTHLAQSWLFSHLSDMCSATESDRTEHQSYLAWFGYKKRHALLIDEDILHMNICWL